MALYQRQLEKQRIAEEKKEKLRRAQERVQQRGNNGGGHHHHHHSNNASSRATNSDRFSADETPTPAEDPSRVLAFDGETTGSSASTMPPVPEPTREDVHYGSPRHDRSQYYHQQQQPQPSQQHPDVLAERRAGNHPIRPPTPTQHPRETSPAVKRSPAAAANGGNHRSGGGSRTARHASPSPTATRRSVPRGATVPQQQQQQQPSGLNYETQQPPLPQLSAEEEARQRDEVFRQQQERYHQQFREQHREELERQRWEEQQQRSAGRHQSRPITPRRDPNQHQSRYLAVNSPVSGYHSNGNGTPPPPPIAATASSRQALLSPASAMQPYHPPRHVSPRVDTGARKRNKDGSPARSPAGHRTAQDWVREEDWKAKKALLEGKNRHRSTSPFRSKSPRFATSPTSGGNRSSVGPAVYDRSCYVRPLPSAQADYYMPKGMADQAGRPKYAYAKPTSDTPRFQNLVPHGNGMVCPVLSGEQPLPASLLSPPDPRRASGAVSALSPRSAAARKAASPMTEEVFYGHLQKQRAEQAMEEDRQRMLRLQIEQQALGASHDAASRTGPREGAVEN